MEWPPWARRKPDVDPAPPDLATGMSGLPAMQSVLPAMPSADRNRDFVQTLPTRWRQEQIGSDLAGDISSAYRAQLGSGLGALTSSIRVTAGALDASPILDMPMASASGIRSAMTALAPLGRTSASVPSGFPTPPLTAPPVTDLGDTAPSFPSVEPADPEDRGPNWLWPSVPRTPAEVPRVGVDRSSPPSDVPPTPTGAVSAVPGDDWSVAVSPEPVDDPSVASLGPEVHALDSLTDPDDAMPTMPSRPVDPAAPAVLDGADETWVVGERPLAADVPEDSDDWDEPSRPNAPPPPASVDLASSAPPSAGPMSTIRPAIGVPIMQRGLAQRAQAQRAQAQRAQAQRGSAPRASQPLTQPSTRLSTSPTSQPQDSPTSAPQAAVPSEAAALDGSEWRPVTDDLLPPAPPISMPTIPASPTLSPAELRSDAAVAGPGRLRSTPPPVRDTAVTDARPDRGAPTRSAPALSGFIPQEPPARPTPPAPTGRPSLPALAPFVPASTQSDGLSSPSSSPTPTPATAETDLDRLAGQLYGRIRSRLVGELLVSRERSQMLTDL